MVYFRKKKNRKRPKTNSCSRLELLLTAKGLSFLKHILHVCLTVCIRTLIVNIFCCLNIEVICVFGPSLRQLFFSTKEEETFICF